jgi:deoxycytidylate deaminase
MSPGLELFVGLVAPLGSEPPSFVEDLEGALATWGYSATVIKLSELLPSVMPVGEHANERIRRLIQAGDTLCNTKESPDAVAGLALREIRAERLKRGASSDVPLERHAFIIDSLKRPGEVDMLRRVYGELFVLVGLQRDMSNRTQQVEALLTSHVGWGADQLANEAKALIELDADETSIEYGQGVNRTFPLSDYFLEEGETPSRIVDLLFGDPSIAPRAGERAMFIANATAASSLIASRRVGAAILDPDKRLIGVGRNEVPDNEQTDVERGFDSNKQDQRSLMNDTLNRLAGLGMLSTDAADQLNRNTDDFLEGTLRNFRGSSVLAVIEYQRAVHAEMDAITDAARRGVSLRGSTLYVTTYPCHLCAKHFSASGIQRTYFIEPYPKSRTEVMYSVSASSIRPFRGVAPRAYQRVFENRVLPEADARGMIVRPPRRQALPLVANAFDVSYLEREKVRLGVQGEAA